MLWTSAFAVIYEEPLSSLVASYDKQRVLTTSPHYTFFRSTETLSAYQSNLISPIWHLFIITFLNVLWTFCLMLLSSYTSKQEHHSGYLTEVNIFIQLYISSDMYDGFKTLHVSLIILLVDTNKLHVNIIIFDVNTVSRMWAKTCASNIACNAHPTIHTFVPYTH